MKMSEQQCVDFDIPVYVTCMFKPILAKNDLKKRECNKERAQESRQ